MKRKITGFFIMFTLISLVTITAHAYKYTEYGDHLYYQINEDGAGITITDYYGAPTEITIPSEIEGLPVTGIGDDAFANCYSLTNINIPGSVTSIGFEAFYNCTVLSDVNLENGVTSIGKRAFKCCESLTSIDIPDM